MFSHSTMFHGEEKENYSEMWAELPSCQRAGTGTSTPLAAMSAKFENMQYGPSHFQPMQAESAQLYYEEQADGWSECQPYNFATPSIMCLNGNQQGVQTEAVELRHELGAGFVVQPPASQRKTNYLVFCLYLQGVKSSIKIKEAKFEKFIDSGTFQENQNGMLYRVTFLDEVGYEFMKYLILWLVDSATNELIVYEGKDRGSSAYNRVLQNHRSTCQRCLFGQNCGNANEKPDNPQLDPHNANTLKFHLKCEQNCQRSSGNQREKRRFKFVVQVTEVDGDPMSKRRTTIAESIDMLIHNNSKRPKNVRS